jgi:hypothetical protein
MLDFLLVLGQIPGTNIQITFNQILAAFCLAYLFYDYRKYEKQIHRWRKWAWYRLGVNYRRRKRMLRTYIKAKKYRLAVFERRIIRNFKTFLRRRRRALIHSYLKTRRLIRKTIRKSYLYAIDQTYGRYCRFVKSTTRWMLRRKRLLNQAVYRRYSSIRRAYYIKQVQIERVQRQIRRSRLAQSFVQFKNFVSQSV